jgi:beta-glucanase (GH16 family)
LATLQKHSWIPADLSQEFHTYAAYWDSTTIIYYVDGREIDRKTHVKANYPAVMILSSTIMGWAGPITDKIDGTEMLVDWVRSYQLPPPQVAAGSTQ